MSGLVQSGDPMAAWKQIVIALVILAAAFVAWVRFVPGAPEVLAGWGMDWAQAAIAPQREASGNAPQSGGRGAGGPQGSVIVGPVAPATINDRLSAIGTGRANASVTVKPYASGRLTEILVRSGSKVEAGAVIARLDAEAEQIARDRANIALDDATARADRVRALRTSNTVTAVQVTEAELAVENARLEVRNAELSLDRRAIVAPIDGVVGILPVEAGNYVTTDTTIATIDDRTSIVVDFWVPERYTNAVAVGAEVEAIPIARPNQVLMGEVSAIDNRLDEASRTMLVQARIANADDTLRAGMSFQVAMRFPGDTYPSVNPLAIQWGTDGAFIWAVRDGKAQRTPVRIIQRNTENVLVEADIGEGDQVVTEGIHLVRDGAVLQIAGAPAAPPEPAAEKPAPVAQGSGS